jgi:hypothetical protein
VSRKSSGLQTRAPLESVHPQRAETHLPHCAQHLVVVPERLQPAAGALVNGVDDERAQRELKLGHVRRQLQLPGLAERTSERRVHDKCAEHLPRNVHRPSARVSARGAGVEHAAHQFRRASPML